MVLMVLSVFVSCEPPLLQKPRGTQKKRPALRCTNAPRHGDEKGATEKERKCGSDQERKRSEGVGLFIGGKEHSICQCFLLQRESQRYGSKPRVEQRKSIKVYVRRKGSGRIVLRHVEGTGILGTGGFMRAGCLAGFAWMQRYTADTERGG